MSKYTNFDSFMQAVINEADVKCHIKYGKSLSEAYNVDTSITRMISIVIKNGGWWFFIALVGLLGLGPLAFGAATLAFVSTPVGIVVVGALAIFGGVEAIKTLYQNRILPIAVKEIGEKYKKDFELNVNNPSTIDELINNASSNLLSKATCLL